MEPIVKEDYDVHILKLVRCGDSYYGGQVGGEEKSDFLRGDEEKGSEPNRFIMMDYFDLLYHIHPEENQKLYGSVLGMAGNLDQKTDFSEISNRVMSLYRITDENKNVSILDECNCDESLSMFPYIGIIQINFTPAFYEAQQKDTATMDPSGINSMLSAEEVAIRGLMGSQNFEIYRVLTSGDLYLIIRAAQYSEIYAAAIRIGQQAVRTGETSKLKYTTYTQVGIECIQKNRRFLTFSDEYVQKHEKEKFVLRFSASKDIYPLVKKVSGCEDSLAGLFGRYDFTANLSMGEFAKLYPVLCQYKSKELIQESQKVDHKKLKSSAATSLIELLVFGLGSGKVHILNERALVPLDSEAEGVEEVEEDVSSHEKVKTENNRIISRYERLNEKEAVFLDNRRAFKDCFQALGELIHTYMPLGYEADSRKNWDIYTHLLNVLFDNIEYYVAMLEKKKANTAYFLDSLRISVKSINMYTRFIQSINRQSLQAPNYEIQTRIDGEKLIIAYSEYMRKYMKEYQTYDWKQEMGDEICKEPRIKAYPIIYPDLDCDGPQILTPFYSGIEQAYDDIEEDREILLICQIPSFEYFARVYDLLPWVTHEVSHHILVLNREKRNEFVIGFLLRYTMKEVFHAWSMQHNKDRVRHCHSNLEDELIDIITEYYTTIFKKKEENWKNYRLKHLKEKVFLFLEPFSSNYADVGISNGGITQAACEKQFAQKFLTFAYQMEDPELFEKVQEYCDKSCKGEEGKDQRGDILQMIFRNLQQSFGEQFIWYNDTFELGLCCPDIFPVEESELMKTRSYVEEKIYYFAEGILTDICENSQAERYIAPLLKNYCFQLLTLNYLFSLFDVEREESEVLELQEEKEACYKQLRKILDQYKDNRKGKAYFCDLEITQIINELELDFYNQDHFFKNWEDHMKLFDRNVLQQWAEKGWALYREACADILMCRAIGFKAFGYLRFVVRNSCDYGQEIMTGGEGINMQRFRLVLKVLTQKDGACKQLIEDIGNYIKTELKRIKDEILKDCDLSDLGKTTIGEALTVQLEGIGAKWESQEKSDLLLLPEHIKSMFHVRYDGTKYRKVYEIVEKATKTHLHQINRVCTLVKYAADMIENGAIKTNRKAFEHMNRIYEESACEGKEALCRWQIPVDNQGAEHQVSGFFNEANAEKGYENAGGMLDSMIKFVEGYYYMARLSKDMDGWNGGRDG